MPRVLARLYLAKQGVAATEAQRHDQGSGIGVPGAAIQFKNEGTDLGAADAAKVNFTGRLLDATRATDEVTVSVSLIINGINTGGINFDSASFDVINLGAGAIAIVGKILNLDDLLDVAAGSPTNGQALVWSSSLAKWVPGIVASSGPLPIHFGTSPPSSPAQGREWVDTDSMIKYTYYNDGTSSQWVEL